eukprot:XP_011676382.1 PREDICTED: uncharacterized protein K02A2.6-like isoform X1 [Strongylocentrotus purpuratus]
MAENSANEMVELQAACSPGIPADTDYNRRGRERQPQRQRQRYEQSHEQGERPMKSEASVCLNCTYEHRNRACPGINDRIPKSPNPNRPQIDPLEIYDDLFAGLGRLRNHEYDITLRNDVNPVKCPPRTIPHKIRDKVKAEIERMEEIGVIERVTEPTDWVSQMTVVHKPDGRVRICLDPRGLNTAIRREHFPMPTFEQFQLEWLARVYFRNSMPRADTGSSL